jgi:hypothetical protein
MFQQFFQELAENPPALILVQPHSSSQIPYFGLNQDSLCSDCAPEVRAGLLAFKQYVTDHYHVAKTIYDWEIYLRK